MTYWAIPTTTGFVTHRGEKKRGEIAVADQINEIGGIADPALHGQFIRKGKRRFPELELKPLLQGYVFAQMDEDVYSKAVHVKGAWGSAMMVPRLNRVHEKKATCPEGELIKFLSRLSDERRKMEHIAEGNDIGDMCHFEPGDIITVLSGPFMDSLVRFREMARASNGRDANILADVELFGRSIPAQFDPLNVEFAT